MKHILIITNLFLCLLAFSYSADSETINIHVPEYYKGKTFHQSIQIDGTEYWFTIKYHTSRRIEANGLDTSVEFTIKHGGTIDYRETITQKITPVRIGNGGEIGCRTSGTIAKNEGQWMATLRYVTSPISGVALIGCRQLAIIGIGHTDIPEGAEMLAFMETDEKYRSITGKRGYTIMVKLSEFYIEP